MTETPSTNQLIRTNIPANALLTTNLEHYFRLVSRGKVRDIYEIDGETLLFVATDRVSAYDEILANGIPGRGKLLTRVTEFWIEYFTTHSHQFTRLGGFHTHLLSCQLPHVLSNNPDVVAEYTDRCMVVKKMTVLPIESIVRGYLTGSAWQEYLEKGSIHTIKMPAGLIENDKLSAPIWTPSTKAKLGEKDVNISPEAAQRLLGKDIADRVAELSLQIYKLACTHAAERGIIIADTKFEFAIDKSSPPQIFLVDEILTPDSSRFWDAKTWKPGQAVKSYDKQYLRDWLTTSNLRGKPNVTIPSDIIERTLEKYQTVYKLLTSRK